MNTDEHRCDTDKGSRPFTREDQQRVRGVRSPPGRCPSVSSLSTLFSLFMSSVVIIFCLLFSVSHPCSSVFIGGEWLSVVNGCSHASSFQGARISRESQRL